MDDHGILDLLEHYGFNRHCRSKLVRHKKVAKYPNFDLQYDVEDLRRRGWLNTFQAFQATEVFKKLDYVVVFLADGGWRSRLVGVYKVLRVHQSVPADLPKGCPYVEWPQTWPLFYELDEQPGFEPLVDRAVILWSGQAWHQHMTNKLVVEGWQVPK
jgi:hypothetical protein